MNESLAYLDDPPVIPRLPALIGALVQQLRVILNHPDMGNAGKLLALADELDRFAPPPPAEDPAAVAASIRGQGAAGLAAALRSWTGSASALFACIAGTGGEPAEVTVSVWQRVNRGLSPAECASLRAPAGTMAQDRKGTLSAGEHRQGLVAEVESVVITSRLPVQAVTSLSGDVPLGLILGRLARREPLGAVPYMGGVASAARLWIGDMPVATAAEHVQPWVCSRLASRRGQP